MFKGNRILPAILFIFLSVAAAAQNRATVSGYIMDAKTGETLIGAGVKDRAIGSVSNSYGFYTLTLPKGEYTLTCSYVGYADKEVSVNLQRDTSINFLLDPDATLKEATIVGKRDAGIESTKMSAIEVPVTLLQRAPVLFGEHDVLKALQLLPGVQSGTEGFSGIYVRGGGPEENLLLLDGISLYNAEHMLGILSIFQPEAVKKVTLYKGSFPARYGGRISSIIDIRSNDGNMKERHGTVSIGALTDRIHLEGPIIKDKLAYSVSARVLHTFLFTPILLANDINGNYYFYDLNGKLSWRISDSDRIYANVYQGRDTFFYRDKEEDEAYNSNTIYETHEDYRIKWGNTLVGARWNHVFNSRLFSNATLAYTRYKMGVDLTYEDITRENGHKYTDEYSMEYNSGMRDITAKMDFDYTPTPKHLIKFGAEYVHHTYIPETISGYAFESDTEGVQIDTTFKSGADVTLSGHEFSIYGEDDFKLWDKLTLNPGLRVAFFYTEGTPYFSLEPRISAKYDINDDISIKASYARMAQYVHLLSPSAISLPIDLWVPITENIKPVTSDQVAVGGYYTGVPGWEFSLEAYYKFMNNVLEYKDGVGFIGNSTNWENNVAMGQGHAYGAELFVEKKTGATTGWLGYTLAWSNRVFPNGEINFGEVFPYRYDRRHNIDIVVNHKFNEKWQINGTWTFASGGTLTVPERYIITTYPNDIRYEEVQSYVSHRNNYRLPPSHRLNLGVTHTKQKKRGTAEWNFSVYNAYNRMNPNLVLSDYYREYKDGKYTNRLVMDKITILPIIPSISYTRSF